MKKMFVAFGIAIAVICGIFAVTSANAQTVEEPSLIEKLEQNFTEYMSDEHPGRTVDNVDFVYIDKDTNYGGYKAAFSYTLDGHAWFATVALNILD